MAHSTLSPLQPTMAGFGEWLKGQTPGHGMVKATVLHHTWSPSAAQYDGLQTIVNIRRYHMEARGFKDIAANAYACPSGFVVTGRPLTESNWAHALVSRSDVEREARELAAGHQQFFNHYAFGLETVANFDEEPTDEGLSGNSLECALRVMTVVHTVYKLPASRLFFHRDVADKSCPGTGLDRAVIRAELAQRLGQALAPDYSPGPVVVKVNDVAYLGNFDGEKTYLAGVPVRESAEAVGCTVKAHFEESPRMIYVYGPWLIPAGAVRWEREP